MYFLQILKNLFKNKFFSDSVSLYSYFIIFSFCGLLIYLLILYYFGVGTLGIFIQVYTFYIIISQVSSLGLHDSAQRSVSILKYKDKRLQETNKISVIHAAIINGSLASIVFFLISSKIGIFIGSEQVGIGLKSSSYAVFFFTLNKVLLAILNGDRKIRMFSFFQILRSTSILFFILFICVNQYPSYLLSYSFVFSEFLISILIIYPLRISIKSLLIISKNKILYHYKFGIKTFFSSFFSEAFIKIDILCISYFMSDKNVGIYSLAALFFEGILQIPTMFRINANPIIAELLYSKNKDKFIKFLKKVCLSSLVLTSVFVISFILVFPVFTIFFSPEQISNTRTILIILLSGLVIYSVVLPFDFIFLQAGMPAIQSALNLVSLLINLSLNIFLINMFGLYGAAIATSIALLFAGINLILLSKLFKLF